MINIHYMEDSSWPHFYIFLIWFFFFFNQLFIAVILLNFLIAMITQSYERVMQHKSKSQYSQKSALNMELKLLQSLFLREKSFNSIIVFSRNEQQSMDDDEGDGWDGFVEAIRRQLHMYFG